MSHTGEGISYLQKVGDIRSVSNSQSTARKPPPPYMHMVPRIYTDRPSPKEYSRGDCDFHNIRKFMGCFHHKCGCRGRCGTTATWYMGIAFESFPEDIITDILYCLESFSSLHVLVTSSVVCYKIFSRYSTTLLLQVAKNIIGGEAWEEATTLLVWQRHSNGVIPDYPAVRKDFETEFVLGRADIPHLIANQRFFDDCAQSHHFGRAGSKSYPVYLEQDPNKAFPAYACSSWDAGHALPTKSFYQMWLLHLRFKYESIETFATHEPFSSQQLVDLCVVARVMFSRRHRFKHLVSSQCSHGADFPEQLASKNLVGVWRPSTKWAVHKSDNPMLRMKMVTHIAARMQGFAEPGVDWTQLFLQVRLPRFKVDYQFMSIEALVKKYEIYEEE